jgi:hypothetical protein
MIDATTQDVIFVGFFDTFRRLFDFLRLASKCIFGDVVKFSFHEKEQVVRIGPSSLSVGVTTRPAFGHSHASASSLISSH